MIKIINIHVISYFMVLSMISPCKLIAWSDQTSLKHMKVQIKEATPDLSEDSKKFANTFLDGEASLKVAKETYESIAREVAQAVRKKLSKYSIPIVEENADIVIVIGVDGALYFTTSNTPILEEAWATGYLDNQEVFKVNFSQKAGFINFKFWNVQKTPQQIGSILAKKISKELKNLKGQVEQ